MALSLVSVAFGVTGKPFNLTHAQVGLLRLHSHLLLYTAVVLLTLPFLFCDHRYDCLTKVSSFVCMFSFSGVPFAVCVTALGEYMVVLCILCSLR